MSDILIATGAGYITTGIKINDDGSATITFGRHFTLSKVSLTTLRTFVERLEILEKEMIKFDPLHDITDHQLRYVVGCWKACGPIEDLVADYVYYSNVVANSTRHELIEYLRDRNPSIKREKQSLLETATFVKSVLKNPKSFGYPAIEEID